MPLLWIVRLVLSLLSLAVLAAAGYLLWSWYEGETVLGPDGVAERVREDWRLWTALALLAWSLLGGKLTAWLLAKPDREPLNPGREKGQMIEGVNGDRLYVESHGRPDAPCLILTHGWSLDSTAWAYAKRDLSRHFRVVTWDLPGMGRSKLGSRVRLEDMAAGLARVIAWTGAERVVLAGHSIGGMTTQTLARDHPQLVRDKVAGAVLVNTTYTNPLKTGVGSGLWLALQKPVLEPLMHLTRALYPLAWLNAWQGYLNGTAHIANRIAFASQVTRSQLDHVSLLTTRNHPGVQADGNLAMFGWDARAALAGLGVPVLVLGGREDILTLPQASRDIAADTPEAADEIIGDANHMGFMERHETYHRAIAAFARSVLGLPARPVRETLAAGTREAARPAPDFGDFKPARPA